MKRDMDLVRYILISAESAEDGLKLSDVEPYGCDAKTAAFHIEMMRAHGLIDAKVTYAFGGAPLYGEVSGLTWEGYEYLDAVRSNRVWEKAKSAVSKSIGEASLSVMKELCSSIALSIAKSSIEM